MGRPRHWASSSQAGRHAFTLVELLVVIGIIAVLVSILLPVLGRVRGQANTVACAANLRGHMQLILVYASENKGSLPWGMAYQRMDANGAPSTGIPAVSGGGTVWPNRYHWWTVVNDMATKNSAGGLWPNGLKQPATIGNQQPKLNKSFQCPEVTSNHNATSLQANMYGFNMVAMPNQSFEVGADSNGTYCDGWTGSTLQTGVNPTKTRVSIPPAKTSNLYGDTAILWDVQLFVPTETGYRPQDIQGGFPLSGIDQAKMKFPAVPRRRYRNMNPDSILPENQEYRPIWMPTEEYEREVTPIRAITQDLFGSTYYPSYFPNVRFRHGKNNVANVAFADGSVRGLTINFKKTAYETSGGVPVADSEFLRSYLRLKKPGALPPTQAGGPQLDIE